MALRPLRDRGEALRSGHALGASLWVSHLTVSDFRCYARAALAAGPEPVVLVGPNGAGKTNLLEALSFLAPGRGLRHCRLEEPNRRSAEESPKPWRVAAEIERPNGAFSLGTGYAGAGGPARARRLVKIDGRLGGSPGALAGALALAWLTPEMERLFTDAPQGRRQFFDRLAVGLDPAHAARLARHDRARRERLRLLRDGPADGAWLAALERTIAEQAVAIAAVRLDLLAGLARALEGQGGPFPKPALAVRGAAEERLGVMPALAAEDELAAALAAARGRDAESGTSEGAQRSDFIARDATTGRPAAQLSTGEQKALLVSILLAQARLLAERRGFPPLLLLDEIAAHFDPARRAALYDELLALGVQCWLTGTEDAVFAPLRGRARFFHVESSAISQE